MDELNKGSFKWISRYGNRFQSQSKLNSIKSSILKGRPTRRIPSQRKIFFGKYNFLIKK